ncbi:MAG: hypothetical protein ACTSR4_08865 [Candidatus Hodarchaeales archaeon]
MKIEAKHLDLGEKIGKIAILTGFFLFLFQGFFPPTALGIIWATFGIITIVAYALKLFLTKGENILNLIVIFGGIGYLFLYALVFVILGVNLALTITLMVVTILLLALLVFELVTKKDLDKYEKYITYLMVFLFGLFMAFGWDGAFGIIGVIFVALGFVLLVAVLYFKGTASKPAE